MNWFKVKLALLGSSNADVVPMLTIMQGVLGEYSGVINPTLLWDNKQQKMLAELTIESLNEQDAKDEAYEVLWDVVFGNIGSSNDNAIYYIDVLEIEKAADITRALKQLDDNLR